MSWWDRLRGREPENREHPGRVEQRAPAAATRPVTWVTPGRPMVPEWDALTAIRRAYYANVFVYRCAQVRAQQVANPKVPLRIGADPDRSTDHDPDAPLLRLLRRNRAVPWRQLAAASSAQLDVTGRFAWELDLDGRSRPAAVYPLIPAYLEPVPTTQPGAIDYWSEFWYRVTGDDAPYRVLKPEQVVYAWRPSLHDWRQPESLLQAARLNVSVATMLDRYNWSFLLNDSRPASVVVTQAFAEGAEFDRFKAEWQGEFGGPDNAGKAAFLEAEMDGDGQADASKWLHVETLGLSQKDAQSIEMYEQELRAITVAFGVPLSILGDSSERTYSNAGEEHRNFWEVTMLPHLQDIADHLTRRFAGLLGDNVCWFDTSMIPALREPSRFAVPVLADMVGRVVTVNEAREQVGLPPTGEPEHDQLDAATPTDDSDDGEAQADPAAASAGGDDSDDLQDDPAPTDDVADRRRQPPPTARTTAAPNVKGRARDPEADAERRAREWRTVDAQARTHERTWERQLRDFFTAQERATLDRLTGKRGRQAMRPGQDLEVRVLGIFDTPFWVARMADLFRGLLEGTFALGAGRIAGRFPAALERVDTAFDVEQPYAHQYILARANQLSGLVTDTTYRQIQRALADGTAAGEDIDEIAARVRRVFTIASQTRAATIARTEVISASNASADLVAEQLPDDLIAGKEWLATPDHRTRPDHREMDGAVVSMRGEFLVGDPPVSMPYPGWSAAPAAQTVNCRCTLVHLSPEEMTSRGGRARPRLVELRTAVRVLDLIAEGVIEPDHIPRILEVAAA